jgi:hypothetical protein
LEYLTIDTKRYPARVSELAHVFSRRNVDDEQIVEPSLGAVQSHAIEKIEAAVGEYLGAVDSGNASLSERGRKGRPEQSARRRLIHVLRNGFGLFNSEEPQASPKEPGSPKKKGSVRHLSDRENRLCEYARIILQDASIETPKRRAGHNDDLNNWIAPAPRDRVGERNRIMHKANEQAPQRNERARWKMPPLIRSIKLEDETIVRFGDVEGRGRPH